MRKKFFLLLPTCLCATCIWSQTRQVTGKTSSNSTGTSLAGTNVNVKNTQTTMATKSGGSFSITIPDKNDAVSMSHFNYNHSLNYFVRLISSLLHKQSL